MVTVGGNAIGRLFAEQRHRLCRQVSLSARPALPWRRRGKTAVLGVPGWAILVASLLAVATASGQLITATLSEPDAIIFSSREDSGLRFVASPVQPQARRRVVEGGSGAALPNPPRSVTDFLGSAATALAEAHSRNSKYPSDAGPFLDHFDPEMPGLAALRGDVGGLVAEASVSSVIEPVADEGDDLKRTLELDWILEINGYPTGHIMRRKIVKVTIEKRNDKQKAWKFTVFDPIDFFKPPS